MAQTGLVFALIIEPMQSEGGDRYASARFYRHLRMITRHLAADDHRQVQTLVWGPRIGVLGFVLSPQTVPIFRMRLPMQKGRRLASFPATRTQSQQARIRRPFREVSFRKQKWTTAPPHKGRKLVTPNSEPSEKYPKLVQRPRQTGFAFIRFALPKHLALIWATILARRRYLHRNRRYRLSHALQQHIASLFETIEASLSYLSEHGPDASTKWQDRFTIPATSR